MQITRYLSNEMILREIGSRMKDRRIALSVTQEVCVLERAAAEISEHHILFS